VRTFLFNILLRPIPWRMRRLDEKGCLYRVRCQITMNLRRARHKFGRTNQTALSSSSWNNSTRLSSICQCIPIYYRSHDSGVDESQEVVRHCLVLFFTHINSQQYCQAEIIWHRCEFINGTVFLEDLTAGKIQACLINALCAVSARYFDLVSTNPGSPTIPLL